MLTKKYYDGFIVHDILDKHLEPGKMMEVLTAFAEAKGVDAVEVIRCKDCVHWEKNNWNPNGMCNAFDDGSVCILTETDADEYCARGERKEE